MTRKERIRDLRKREKTHVRSLRYCIRHGLYVEAMKNLGWAMQVQATREALETLSQ